MGYFVPPADFTADDASGTVLFEGGSDIWKPEAGSNLNEWKPLCLHSVVRRGLVYAGGGAAAALPGGGDGSPLRRSGEQVVASLQATEGSEAKITSR